MYTTLLEQLKKKTSKVYFPFFLRNKNTNFELGTDRTARIYFPKLPRSSVDYVTKFL